MLKLDSKIEQAAEQSIPFKNFAEDLENDALINRNALAEQRLRRKYHFICFYDSDCKEVSVNIEWSKRMGGQHAQHTLVTQKIASHTGNNIAQIVAYLGEVDLEPYYVNAEMFALITRCPAPFNDTRTLIVNVL